MSDNSNPLTDVDSLLYRLADVAGDVQINLYTAFLNRPDATPIEVTVNGTNYGIASLQEELPWIIEQVTTS